MSWFGFDKYRIQNANPNHLNIFFFLRGHAKKRARRKAGSFQSYEAV